MDEKRRIQLKYRRLSREVERSRLSQNAWAFRLGVSKSYFSQLLRGRKRRPGPELRRKLLEAFDLEFDELFEVSACQPKPKPAERMLALFELRLPGLRIQVHRTQPGRSMKMRKEKLMMSLPRDLRYALRTLVNRPGFTAVAALTLALGIGVNSLAFSAVDAVLFGHLPYPQADRLVQIWEIKQTRNQGESMVAPLNFRDWREQSRNFESMAAYLPQYANFNHEDAARRVSIVQATASLFSVLGIDPLQGRTFDDAAETAGNDAVVLISDSFWRGRLGADEEALGKSVSIDGRAHTILGIMPPDFGFPSPDVSIYKPLVMEEERGGRYVLAVGRLQTGSSVEAAEQDLKAVAARLAQDFPQTNKNWSVALTKLGELEARSSRLPLLFAWFSAAMVLIVACVNLANLGLSSLATRQREICLRMALGAPSARILRQLLAESLLLSALGGLLGLAIAWWGAGLLSRIGASAFPGLETIALDGRALGFTAALSLATGLAFGLLPAYRAGKVRLEGILRAGGRGSTIGEGRLRQALIALEAAVAIAVLASAGLTLRSLLQLSAVDPGFDPGHLVMMRIEPPMVPMQKGQSEDSYIESIQSERRLISRFYDRLLDRIKALPGVESAAAANRGPLGTNSWVASFSVQGRPVIDATDRPTALARVVTPGYFDTMGIGLRQGRALESSDSFGAARVVVIDEALAQRNWGRSSPIGDRLTIQSPEDENAFWFTIVGVSSNLANRGLDAGQGGAIYFNLPQAIFGHFGDWGMQLAIRTASHPAGVVESVREQVRQLDSSLPVFQVRTGSDLVARQLLSPRLQSGLLGSFAALALALSAVGVFSMVTFSVSRRRQELGLRRALGAQSINIYTQVIAYGMTPTLLGSVAGLFGAAAISRAISGSLFGVSPLDAVSLGLSCALLLAIAFLACLLPARRAVRTDPQSSLRLE